MSKITNDWLTLSGTGCFLYICIHIATVARVKGLMLASNLSRLCLRISNEKCLMCYRRRPSPPADHTPGSSEPDPTGEQSGTAAVPGDRQPGAIYPLVQELHRASDEGPALCPAGLRHTADCRLTDLSHLSHSLEEWSYKSLRTFL